MIVVRSALFMVWVSLFTMVLASLIALVSLVHAHTGYRLVALWRSFFTGAVRYILGIKTVVRGAENMPTEPAVILSKHQSAWETVALQNLVPAGRYCVFVLKKELLRLPFFGWALAAMPMISIDRSAGKEALNAVVDQGRDRLQRGFYVIIFPEGTRVAPGEHKRYKMGGAHLAASVGSLVVPIAHNAGEVWPRQAFIKRPGTITVSIGPAFSAAGLSEAEVNKRVEEWIEGEMRKLSPHRYPDAQPQTAAV